MLISMVLATCCWLIWEALTDGTTKKMFVSGLEKLLADVQQYSKGAGVSPAATPEQATSWYLNEFESKERAIQDAMRDAKEAEAEAKQRADSARLAASEQRMRLLMVIGVAVVALLFFLLLPLMIQIEQNTRRQQEPQADL
jgi:hypothetical protein